MHFCQKVINVNIRVNHVTGNYKIININNINHVILFVNNLVSLVMIFAFTLTIMIMKSIY